MANAPIPNPGWLALLTRLGIQRFGRFFLQDQVVPVAVVDASAVTLSAVSSPPLFGTPASAGEVANPAAGTRLADTGQLAAGNWTVLISISSGQSNSYRIRRRNAADAADVWSVLVNIPNEMRTLVVGVLRFSFANNERLVVENVGVGTATYQASIFAVQD